MLRTSEWVSLGHPDKIADYISSYLLDRHLERDPKTRFAVEVMVKDQIVTLGGEIASEADFSDDEITQFVRNAVNEIGYTRMYQEKWGRENTVCGDQMEVYPLLGRQSPDIGQGVERDAWGDQGIFFGMALDRPSSGNMPRDHYLARKLGLALFRSRLGGLDIKTLVATRDGNASHVTIAIPLMDGDVNEDAVRRRAEETTGCRDLTLNGTGRYVTHSSVADCGVTGRKLAVDFYGGNCRIGGGSTWGKDATKADVTLNIHARKLALDFMRKYRKHTVVCAISCSIGSPEIEVAYTDGAGRELHREKATARPADLMARYGLDQPVFAKLCREGLFHGLR
ncbi:MAG: methionine adenosyltransferase domain-containing protein [Lentisphaeria bacterium]|jgi:S-adenosylmethionine synthetase